mmetsp:Transcript_1277/g.1937  ORF Transcript_1277/g.1937 Transcript_1277/m.1937 type:complete len:144 (-) Transcript_1277:426-857(-)|eukprot:CAMPEP_0194199300 /NCGR_PEP_ID=MMETSP0156-20130528/373_1 /TAXON_ID=33649 /ORGANISM="Thalassionema nitzschioides, Strain L26-B" /LENGTH=143 /DNA_ID=CAMNT_0038924177 /DNA_START=255 /DNA_END=686 /DNA_ORIENTATION=-
MLQIRSGETSTSNSVLPLSQSIRSPHYEAADEQMAKFHRKKQTKMVLLGLMAAASTVGVIGKANPTLIQPEYALRRRLLQQTTTNNDHNTVDTNFDNDEPSIFTPRIVLDAMMVSEAVELQDNSHRLLRQESSSTNEEVPPAT